MRLAKIFLFLLVALSALTACQNEADEIKVPLPAQAFNKTSPVADLIARTTLLDGSVDNILDSASCASLVLPVTVVVNGQEIIVNTVDDLKFIERIVDKFESDEDEVSIAFPIVVVLEDYSQLIIQNEDELESLMEQCTEGGSDEDIECIDFVYPVKLVVYNVTNQVSEVITIDTDKALHEFIDVMKEGDLVSFKFPVTMQSTDGTEVIVNDNDELEAAIENASGECDEDDDTDFDDDDVDDSSLVSILINASWSIDYFFDETDQTSQFSTFTFTFNSDGTVLATDGVNEVNGTWITYGDDGTLELVLDFDEITPLNELNEDWGVIEFTDQSITLKDESDDGERIKTLVFEKL